MTETGWNLDNSYTWLPESFYSIVEPTPVKSPEIVMLNESLASFLGLDIIKLREEMSVLAGNSLPENSVPVAQAYAGHQFGYFTMLGDGRALLIGEQINPEGKRFDIQLKGSGRTPYSRGGDGRAALGPMLREYVISEAMYGLGIPTTRSLAVVTTGEDVVRDKVLPGAVLTRVAESHIRVGTFQFVSGWCTADELRALADYTISRHYPYIEGKEPYLQLLREVIKRQAELIVKWQLVGFIHGVMNTDNMAISGETIDYGPCAFMDTYDEGTVFSTIDTYGRYAYGNQPNMAVWNLARFAESILLLIHENQDKAVEIAQNTLEEFNDLYNRNWLSGMRAKLGLFSEEEQDEALVSELLRLMYKFKGDYTNTFRALTLNSITDTDLFNSPEFSLWHDMWKARLARQEQSEDEIYGLMKRNNPAVIPRNHRVEEALDAAVSRGDYSVAIKLLEVLKKPYGYTKEQDEYAKTPPPSLYPYKTFCGT